MKVIILAAGKGTRMKSDKLKVMHQVGAQHIISYVLEAVMRLKAAAIYMIVGHQSQKLEEFLPKDVNLVEQKEQLGTGHAVMQAAKYFSGNKNETVLVLPGDCPLIKTETLNKLYSLHKQEKADATILTTKLKDPASYGRILRGETGLVHGIREAKDCSREELAIKEVNTGIYLFSSTILFEALKKVTTDNKQGEYYLTDVIEIMVKAKNIIVAYCTDDAEETRGINSRKDLAAVNKNIYSKINDDLMANGVTILDPHTTYVDATAKISKDVEIAPFTIIKGKTVIEKNCVIGPYSYLENCKVTAGQIVPPDSKLRDVVV
ncbi:bifunctional N-acetylglucosamine-1-phosphate uridyltransferase/glucosamine-1-phosphate acetyltransferase [Candidatus Margulisiibacteriota bacterium]